MDRARRRATLAPRTKLNLGAGDRPIKGYDNSFDLRRGRACYPLQVPDGSVAEIRASHVLEHFSHRQALDVLKDWVRALAPGGLLKLAVPDFEYIAQGYVAGRPEPWQGYVCGGHVDDNDRHGALYDAPSLAGLMYNAGLVGPHYWKDDARDCASLPVSLNLAAWKPLAAYPRTVCVMSVPRLGFQQNFTSLLALRQLGIVTNTTTGAFWGQCITRAIERAVGEDHAEWVLTADYDSIFDAQTVIDLIATAAAHPQYDALACLQSGRSLTRPPLMVLEGPDGKPLGGQIPRDHLLQTVVPALTAHFGLTILRASALRKLPRPWFYGKPDPDGRWEDGRVDDDIAFWHAWRAAGNTLAIAPRCVIGHAELYVIWPGRDLQPTPQQATEYQTSGAPMNVWR